MNNNLRSIILRRLAMSTKRVIIIRIKKKPDANEKRQNILKDIRDNFLRAMLVDPDKKEIVSEYVPSHADVLNAWLFS